MSDSLRALLAEAEALLFDFDGVVVDSEPTHYQAYVEAFAPYGHRPDKDVYWVYWTDRGDGVPGELSRCGLDPALADEIKASKRQIFQRLCEQAAFGFFPGAIYAMRAAAASPLKCAIASNSSPEAIAAVFAAHGEEPPLPIVGRREGMRAKPAPDVFLAAAEQLGVEPARCVVIEDAAKGINAAVSAGMAPVVSRYRLNAAFDYPAAAAELQGLAALPPLLPR